MEAETRVALLGIIVENPEEVEKLNQILHEYAEYIIGRMGIPYSKKKMNVISIVLDAPENKISALSGKIGMLKGISSKVIYGKKC
ncbi:MAG: iron-only hydrogenase system regulator [Lachnospiraceae bacterium]|nr:iron-only hydrogenase system regulator [Lachnospiraceae bacterium]